MKYINTKLAPKAVGPYSQAIEHNGIIYCSGQIGIDPETGNLVEGFENQVLQSLNNLKNVLESANSDISKALKVTVYLSDMNNYSQMNEICSNFFGEHKPARVTVEVSRLPKDCLFEIDCIAYR